MENKFKEMAHTKTEQVPIYKKLLLTVPEAAKFSGIGENKLRSLISFHEDDDWVFHNGSRIMIKRKAFENFLSCTTSI